MTHSIPIDNTRSGPHSMSCVLIRSVFLAVDMVLKANSWPSRTARGLGGHGLCALGSLV